MSGTQPSSATERRRRADKRVGEAVAASPQPPAPPPVPRSAARSAARRDYALWASWACGIAAAVLLAAGIALYCSESASVAQPPQPCASGEPAQPAVTSIIHLRRQFDDLVTRNDARQIGIEEFSRGVRSIIADSQTLLARKDLPEPNAIHAQKLVADGYGAIAEYQKEFTAYVAFAGKLSNYYAVDPRECSGSQSEGFAVGDAILLSALLEKADAYRTAGQHLLAVPFYEDIRRRFAASDFAAYSLYRMGECYSAHDAPAGVDTCQSMLVEKYSHTPWGVALLAAKAQALLKVSGRGWRDAADTYLRIAEVTRNQEQSFSATLAAAEILVALRDYGSANRALATAQQVAATEEQRRTVHEVRSYAMAAELPAKDVLTIIQFP
jgi:hypothetical protein